MVSSGVTVLWQNSEAKLNKKIVSAPSSVDFTDPFLSPPAMVGGGGTEEDGVLLSEPGRNDSPPLTRSLGAASVASALAS